MTSGLLETFQRACSLCIRQAPRRQGYDSDDIRKDLLDRGIEPVIAPLLKPKNNHQV
jgi:hypothetical protein